MDLTRLPKLKSKKRAAKRIGRGYGSGKGGHTVGRGQKGQKARGKVSPGFEGGQLPLGKRLPVRKGFRRAKREPVTVINLKDLAPFGPGTLITPPLLREAGLLARRKTAVKILSDGKVTSGLIFKGVTFSKAANEKIKIAGLTHKKRLES